MRDPLLIVKSVRVTEKGTALAEKHNQYVLKVAPSATKQEIKHAVKQLFQKTAIRVNTMQVAWQAQAPSRRRANGPAPRLEKSHRHAQGGRKNRTRLTGTYHGTQNFSSPHAVPPFHGTERFRGTHAGQQAGPQALTERIKKSGGRNNRGRVTSRHIGGGHKQRYRFIDFKRNKLGIKAKVETIEYDPCRTARIALLKYADGEQCVTSSPRSASRSARR